MNELLEKLAWFLGWVLCVPCSILTIVALFGMQWLLALGIGSIAVATCPPLRLRQRYPWVWFACLLTGLAFS